MNFENKINKIRKINEKYGITGDDYIRNDDCDDALGKIRSDEDTDMRGFLTKEAKLIDRECKLEKEKKKLWREREDLVIEVKKFEEERAKVAKDRADLDALKKELHQKKHEQSDLAQILETPPPTHS